MERKEKIITKRRLIKTILFTAATLAAGKVIYDFADSMKPTYVVNGFSTGTMDDNSYIWQRPVDWRRR